MFRSEQEVANIDKRNWSYYIDKIGCIKITFCHYEDQIFGIEIATVVMLCLKYACMYCLTVICKIISYCFYAQTEWIV